MDSKIERSYLKLPTQNDKVNVPNILPQDSTSLTLKSSKFAEERSRNHKIEIKSPSKDFTSIFLILLEKKSFNTDFDFRLTILSNAYDIIAIKIEK